MQVVPLHTPLHAGKAEQHAYLLVGAAGSGGGGAPSVTLLPDTPPARQLLAQRAPSTFFWTAGPAGGPGGASRLTGYGLEVRGEGGGVGAVEAWALALPGELLALAAHDPLEPVYTHVKVGGAGGG